MTRSDAYSIVFFKEICLERGNLPGRHCRLVLRNKHPDIAICLSAERMSALFEAVGHKQDAEQVVPEAQIEISGDYKLFAHPEEPPSGSALSLS